MSELRLARQSVELLRSRIEGSGGVVADSDENEIRSIFADLEVSGALRMRSQRRLAQDSIDRRT